MRAIVVFLALAVPAAAEGHVLSFGYRYPEKKRSSRSSTSCRTWIPGYYRTVHRDVWVPERCESVWQPAEFGWRQQGSLLVQYVTRPAGYVTVRRPAHTETRCHRVWVSGRYAR